MSYSKSKTLSIFAGCILASMMLTLLTGVANTVFAQSSASETPQDQTGYFLQSGIDILPSAGPGSSTTPRVLIVNGHRFTPQTSVGVGIGFTPYNTPLSLIPFFFDFNYRLIKQGISPILFIRAGYNFTVKGDDSFLMDSHTGGLLLHPGIGLEIPIAEQFGLYVSAGYNIDNSSYVFETWGNRTVINDLSYRRVALSIGFKLTP